MVKWDSAWAVIAPSPKSTSKHNVANRRETLAPVICFI
jgi:hypothetical protein